MPIRACIAADFQLVFQDDETHCDYNGRIELGGADDESNADDDANTGVRMYNELVVAVCEHGHNSTKRKERGESRKLIQQMRKKTSRLKKSKEHGEVY